MAAMTNSDGYRATNAPKPSLRLEPALIKELSRRSLPQTLLYIASQWAAIFACIAIAHGSRSYLVLVLCLCVIATRQHALAALVHEGCHYNLCNSKPLNDLLTNLFAAFPLSISVKRYRRSHLAHHRLVNEIDDPDRIENTPPHSLAALVGLVLMDLSFLSLPKNLRRSRKFGALGLFTEKGDGWKAERRLYVAFLAVVIVSATAFGAWKYIGLYWFVPFFSVLQALTRLRGYTEHAGRMDEVDDLLKSRTVEANMLERFLFAPARVNLHLEHHLYPAVPFYNLERLHVALREKATGRTAPPSAQGYFRWPALRRSAFGEVFLRRAPPATPAE